MRNPNCVGAVLCQASHWHPPASRHSVLYGGRNLYSLTCSSSTHRSGARLCCSRSLRNTRLHNTMRPRTNIAPPWCLPFCGGAAPNPPNADNLMKQRSCDRAKRCVNFDSLSPDTRDVYLQRDVYLALTLGVHWALGSLGHLECTLGLGL